MKKKTFVLQLGVLASAIALLVLLRIGDLQRNFQLRQLFAYRHGREGHRLDTRWHEAV